MSAPAAVALDSAIVSAIRRSIATAERREQPYRNWRMADVLPDAVAREVVDLPFTPIDVAGISGKRELHNAERQYFAGEVLDKFPVARAVAEAFHSPAVVGALAEATGAKLDGTYLRIEYALDIGGFWLEPHTDLGVKAFTLLHYLGEPGQEDLGTDLYAAPDAWAERVPFLWNTAAVFVPSDRTYHGFERRPIERIRRSLIVNYVTDEWRAREQLAFGTPVHA